MSAASRHHNNRAGYNARKNRAPRAEIDEAIYRANQVTSTAMRGITIIAKQLTGTHEGRSAGDEAIYSTNND